MPTTRLLACSLAWLVAHYSTPFCSALAATLEEKDHSERGLFSNSRRVVQHGKVIITMSRVLSFDILLHSLQC